jgi:hypothetical protein
MESIPLYQKIAVTWITASCILQRTDVLTAIEYDVNRIASMASLGASLKFVPILSELKLNGFLKMLIGFIYSSRLGSARILNFYIAHDICSRIAAVNNWIKIVHVFSSASNRRP